jgi:hypothetical protein
MAMHRHNAKHSADAAAPYITLSHPGESMVESSFSKLSARYKMIKRHGAAVAWMTSFRCADTHSRITVKLILHVLPRPDLCGVVTCA